MTDMNDSRYYAERATKALLLADSATNPAIAQIHREMAAKYRELARLGAEAKPTLRVVGG
jgi:NADPH-dependent ferric siderophore reductase